MESPRIAGVLGGVGVSTLARALRALDCGIYPGGHVHVLVCRSTMVSLGAAQCALAAAPADRPPVLAVVSDGGPLTSAMRASLRMTEPHAGAVVHVPYVPGWRDLARPWDAAAEVLAVEPPKDLRRFTHAVELLAEAITPDLLETAHDFRPRGLPQPHDSSPVTHIWPTAI